MNLLIFKKLKFYYLLFLNIIIILKHNKNMDIKYYTIEEIKELGDNKITEIIKNNILKSVDKDFIINLTITYDDAINISLFGDHDWNETIFGNNIYTYGGIFL